MRYLTCILLSGCTIAGSPIRAALVSDGGAQGTPAIYDVTAFGAACDGITDDAPALQAALNALEASTPNKGGVVTIGDCTLRLATSTSLTSGSEGMGIKILGTAGSASRVLVDGNDTTTPIHLVQGQTLGQEIAVEGLTFVRPNPPATGDQTARSLHVIWLQNASGGKAAVRNCQFYGITAASDIIRIDGGGQEVTNVGMWGIRSGLDNGVSVDACNIDFHYPDLAVLRTLRDADYGLLDGKSYAAAGASTSGVCVIPAPPQAPHYEQPRGVVSIEDCQFDEGWGTKQIQLNTPATEGIPAARLGVVRISGIFTNAPSYGGSRVIGANQVDRLYVDTVQAAWSYASNYAVELDGVAHATLKNVQVDDTDDMHSNMLQIDDPLYGFMGKSGTIRVYDSNFYRIDGTPTKLVVDN